MIGEDVVKQVARIIGKLLVHGSSNLGVSAQSPGPQLLKTYSLRIFPVILERTIPVGADSDIRLIHIWLPILLDKSCSQFANRLRIVLVDLRGCPLEQFDGPIVFDRLLLGDYLLKGYEGSNLVSRRIQPNSGAHLNSLFSSQRCESLVHSVGDRNARIDFTVPRQVESILPAERHYSYTKLGYKQCSANSAGRAGGNGKEWQ